MFRVTLPLALAFVMSLPACRDVPRIEKDSVVEVSAREIVPPAGGRTVVFKDRPSVVGAKSTTTQSTMMSMSLAAGGDQRITIEEANSEERTREVLAVSQGLSTKVRVKYLRSDKVSKIPGTSTTSPTAVAGKTYVVTARGDTIEVRDAQGNEVSAEEEQIVRDDNRSLGKPDEVTAALAKKPRRVGESLDDVAAAFEKQFAKGDIGDGGEVDVTKFVLREVETVDGHEVAVFDVAMTMNIAQESLIIRVDLSGEMRMHIDDEEVGGMSLSGPIQIKGIASGSGTMTMKLATRR